MTMHRPFFTNALFACLVCALLAAPSPLSAQSLATGLLHVGVTGGMSLPGGALQMITKTGWNAGAFVSIGAPVAPLSLRIEGQWNQFNGKPQLAGDRPTEYDDFRIIDATANAVYAFPSTSVARFYVIGGVGIYNERSTMRLGSSTTDTTATKVGVNAGAGVHLQLRRLATIVELRYHYIMRGGEITPYGYFGSGHQGMHIFPISVGIVL
jgi:opacity protein-like surface antigen